MKPLVIHHAQCRDGFGAAWCVWRRSPNAEFYPAFHGTHPPNVKGRMVYLLDFCYPRKVLAQMADECHSMMVLDHHKTAAADLDGFSHPKVKILFDMERSGAGITWDDFFPNQDRPWIIDYVEDRDLWRNKLPNSPAVNAYISTLRYNFEDWYKASRLDLEEVIRAGTVVEDKIRSYVIEVAKNSRRIVFHGYEIPVVNAPQVDISELVGFLSNGETFAMGWWQRADGMFVYSLRSRGDFDVSEIAKKYGGGGHKNAAGFQCKELVVK